MILIGLSGSAGSGKNYVADQIVAKYGNVKQLAFADPLKQVVHHMFGIPLEDCYTEAGKNRKTWVRWNNVKPYLDGLHEAAEKGHAARFYLEGATMTVRDLLQWVGTDLVRKNWCQDHWIMLAEQRIRASVEDVVVVTDVRFENEANLVTAMGGTVLKVVGRAAPGVPQHVSEQGKFYVAGMIDNSEGRTAAQLTEQVEAFVHGLDRVTSRC